MENPWLRLPKNAPFVLEEDWEAIEKFNSDRRLEHKIWLDSYPVPYVGDVLHSRVVLLQLNPGSVIPPGFDHANNEYGSFPGLLEAEKKNIQHTNVRFPFYPINPELLLTDDFRYWSKTLKPFLKSEKSYEKVSKDISCIEFFPYHSANFNFREKLHCQKYGFYLLEKAIERKAMIVLMRAKKEWLDAVPELKKIDYCVLKQVRNVSLSEKNMMPGDFQSLGEILG